MPSFSKIILLASAAVAIMAAPAAQLGGLPLAGGLPTGVIPSGVIPDAGDLPGAGDLPTGDLPTGTTGDLPTTTSGSLSATTDCTASAGLPVATTTTADPAGATQTNTSFTCSKGSAVACCNTSEGDSLLGNVLSGSCTLSNLALAGVNAGNTCSGANTYCCPVNQTGDLDINASCSPITL